MPSPPPIIFEVTFTVPQEMRWCMRAKGAFDDWIHSEAESADRPIAELPAADLAMQVDHCELTLKWIELPADSAWHAVRRAAEIIEQVLPEMLRTRAMRTSATMQNPDPDVRRPVGS
ncbi:MAG TPA: hypothetical protein VGO80_16860 [Solirubrobacteraceae bacterium]|jgi:hypothetical protein|nr:hypothetical protein [Solirubrobacteraceae bacterium]